MALGLQPCEEQSEQEQEQQLSKRKSGAIVACKTLQVASNMATGKKEKGKKRDFVNDAEDDAKQEQGQDAVTRGRSKEKCRKNKKRRPRTPKEKETRRSSRPKENEARRTSRTRSFSH